MHGNLDNLGIYTVTVYMEMSTTLLVNCRPYLLCCPNNDYDWRTSTTPELKSAFSATSIGCGQCCAYLVWNLASLLKLTV